MIITKFKAAESQLITAIDLFFDGDPISAHTLTRSSHEIFDSLCKHRGLERSVIQEGVTNMVKPEFQKIVIRKINESKNFFKHADRDPNESISFNPTLSEYLIWDSTAMYRRLNNNKMLCEVLVFSTIFRVKHHELWEDNSKIGHLPLEESLKELEKNDQGLIYKELLSRCQRGEYNFSYE